MADQLPQEEWLTIKIVADSQQAVNAACHAGQVLQPSELITCSRSDSEQSAAQGLGRQGLGLS